MQLWFLRTDGDKFDKKLDISECNKFIYSTHGSCGHQDTEELKSLKSKIFPNLKLNERELRKSIQSIKFMVIDNQILGWERVIDKKRCDLFITYWIATMQYGDIVVVRNKENVIYICEITGYVIEEFYNAHGSFQRPVNIIDIILPNNFHRHPLFEMQQRTRSRCALQRNRDSVLHNKVVNYVATLKLNS